MRDEVHTGQSTHLPPFYSPSNPVKWVKIFMSEMEYLTNPAEYSEHYATVHHVQSTSAVIIWSS
jgi:hypothetical protein